MDEVDEYSLEFSISRKLMGITGSNNYLALKSPKWFTIFRTDGSASKNANL